MAADQGAGPPIPPRETPSRTKALPSPPGTLVGVLFPLLCAFSDLFPHLGSFLHYFNLILDHAEAWLLSYFKKINLEDKGMELDIYTNLIKEVQPLLEYRKTLLIDPIELKFEIQPNSKEYEAVQRAVETGKPFSWYHFGTSELQNLFKSVKVSGKYPDTSEEWKKVKDYVDRKGNPP